MEYCPQLLLITRIVKTTMTVNFLGIPHFTGNDKGLYATMYRWRIDP